MTRPSSIIGVALFVLGLAQAFPGKENDGFELNVVHLNDFHARFDQSTAVGGICKPDDLDDCLGGFSRMYRAIDDILQEQPDSILLNGGDNFQGTPWYNIYKWNVTQYFMNKLPFDAIVLGNHEFDDKIAGLVPFITSLKAPVVVSNIDDSDEPDMQGIYKKSVVVERNGKKIGIIGVIIKTTNEISSTENLKFLDESESVNKEAERLVKEEGVFTNIVLSHSGYDVEKVMAQKTTAASKIGLIVGGHSHTFLYTGEPLPGPDKPAGPYPTIIERDEDGHEVLVVQASAYCRYLGNLLVTYDDNGNYANWVGKPIYLDRNRPQDEAMNKELAPWKEAVDEQSNKVIGSSLVELERDDCYTKECLLGNFVADAMVFGYAGMANTSIEWTYASIAVTNAGSLRTPIPAGDITYGDLLTAQPFGNTLDVGEIQGKYIKEMFEFTTKSYYHGREYGQISLLQVSGIKLVLNLDKPQGSRVESVKLRCRECHVPVYEDLELEKTYRLVTNSFLRNGGDGYTMLRDNLQNVQVGLVDDEYFLDYLEARSPVYEEVEGRIEVISSKPVVSRNLRT